VSRARTIPLLAILCIAAQLLVATATLWHHHDDDDAPDQCSVCVAVLAAHTGDVPAASSFVAPAPVVDFVVETPELDGSVVMTVVVLARGPPASAQA
jgi:hypothetical protein